MRGEILYKVLDALEDKAIEAVDFVDVVLRAGYGANFSRFDYEYSKKNEKNLKIRIDRENKRRLQKYISKLKSDGLVSKDDFGMVLLSKKGRKKLLKLKENPKIDKKTYHKKLGVQLIIISYDLPKEFKRERDILREILKLLGFTLIHQSVWVGKIKLPKQFLVDLEKLGILKFVEILEVTKSGSLKSFD